MSDDAAIRRQNLARLRLTPKQLVERAGRSPSYWRDLLSDPKKSFGEKAARSIEGSLDLPRGWLDDVHGDEKPAALKITEPAPSFRSPLGSLEISSALQALAAAFATAPPELREALALNLSGWVREGGGEHWLRSITALLSDAPSKQPRTGTR